jgi:hypothetical protein
LKHRADGDSVRTSVQSLFDVLVRTTAASSDDRDVDAIGNNLDEIEIHSAHFAVAIDRGEENFTGAPALYLLRPLDRMAARRPPPALCIDIIQFNIDRSNDRLRSETSRQSSDEIRFVEDSSAERNFVCSPIKEGSNVIIGADPPAYRERHEQVATQALYF